MMLKIALVLVKNVLLGLKKGISGLACWVAAKSTAYSRSDIGYLQKHFSEGN